MLTRGLSPSLRAFGFGSLPAFVPYCAPEPDHGAIGALPLILVDGARQEALDAGAGGRHATADHLGNRSSHDHGGLALIQRRERAAHGALGAFLTQLFLAEAGHDHRQLVRRQCVGIVQHGGHGQVLAAHRAIDDHLHALHRGEDVDGAPVAAGAIEVLDQHQTFPPSAGMALAATRLAFSGVLAGRGSGLRSHIPAVSPLPTPSKKAVMRSKRSLLASAALTTCASEPAPAAPINGRAEIRFVKYRAGIDNCLACCTTGVVPIARSGLIASTADLSCSSEARNWMVTPRASSHSRSGSDHWVLGAAVPT